VCWCLTIHSLFRISTARRAPASMRRCAAASRTCSAFCWGCCCCSLSECSPLSHVEARRGGGHSAADAAGARPMARLRPPSRVRLPWNLHPPPPPPRGTGRFPYLLKYMIRGKPEQAALTNTLLVMVFGSLNRVPFTHAVSVSSPPRLEPVPLMFPVFRNKTPRCKTRREP
jgi:hypothetical protein